MPDRRRPAIVLASISVTDLPALVGKVDELVALSPDFDRIEDGTFWDGWQERPGEGFLFESEVPYLEDDPRQMLDLALALVHLQARGLEVETSAIVESRRRTRRHGAAPTFRFDVEFIVEECDVIDRRRAARWLGALAHDPGIPERAAVALIGLLEGVEIADLRTAESSS
jgi:hypothetical protein